MPYKSVYVKCSCPIARHIQGLTKHIETTASRGGQMVDARTAELGRTGSSQAVNALGK